jgi:hypothetical protein
MVAKKLKVGQQVSWTSRGETRIGEIVAVVEPNQSPMNVINTIKAKKRPDVKNLRSYRPISERAFIVSSNGVGYRPRVKSLVVA